MGYLLLVIEFFLLFFNQFAKFSSRRSSLLPSPFYYFFLNRFAFHMLLLVFVWNLPFLHRDSPQCLWAQKVKSKRRRNNITGTPPNWFKNFLQMNQQNSPEQMSSSLSIVDMIKFTHSTDIYWEPTMSQALLAFGIHLWQINKNLGFCGP